MIKLQAGDVFATENPWFIGRAINLAQWIWSKDNESRYSHAGIITNSEGATLESLATVKEQNLFKDYAGKEVVIARFDADRAAKRSNLNRIRRQHLGDKYPAWRIVLHLLPPLAKFITAGGRHVVCSELVAKYLNYCGIRPGPYTGVNPDTLADEWHKWKKFKVIFEGTLPAKTGPAVHLPVKRD